QLSELSSLPRPNIHNLHFYRLTSTGWFAHKEYRFYEFDRKAWYSAIRAYNEFLVDNLSAAMRAWRDGFASETNTLAHMSAKLALDFAQRVGQAEKWCPQLYGATFKVPHGTYNGERLIEVHESAGGTSQLCRELRWSQPGGSV